MSVLPDFSINYFAPLVQGAACSVGQIMIPNSSDGSNYVPATTANRSGRGSEGIAVTAWGGPAGSTGQVRIVQNGVVAAAITGLGAGTRSIVRCSATGLCERVVSPDPDDDIVGYCEEDGRLHAYFGMPFSLISGSLGGSPALPNKTVQTGLGGIFKSLEYHTRQSRGRLHVERHTMTGQPELVFDAATKTITRGFGTWTNDEFEVGDILYITGTVSNNSLGNYTVSVVTDLTLTVLETLVNETVDASSNQAIEGGGFITYGLTDGTMPIRGAHRMMQNNNGQPDDVWLATLDGDSNTIPFLSSSDDEYQIGGTFDHEDSALGTEHRKDLGVWANHELDFVFNRQRRNQSQVFQYDAIGTATTSTSTPAFIVWLAGTPNAPGAKTVIQIRAKNSVHEAFWTFSNGVLVDSIKPTGTSSWNATVLGSAVTVNSDNISGNVAWFAVYDLYGNAGLGSGGGGSFHATSVANLRLLTGSLPNRGSATLSGYYADSDGGGGTFFWDTSSSTGDDGGTIIVPTGSSTGRWRRIWSGRVNVRWFGAKGDGTTDDTAAIQAAINVTTNTKVVEFPQGRYKIVPQANAADAALIVTSTNVVFSGVGSSSWNGTTSGEIPTIIVAAASDGVGVGILIERDGSTNIADLSEIRNLNFVKGTNAPQAFVAIHAVQCTVDGCSFSNAAQYGVIFESGPSCILTLQGATYQYADYPHVSNCSFFQSGNYTTGDGNPNGADGAALLIRGNDSGGGIYYGNQSTLSNVAFADNCLVQGTWIGNYSQFAVVGYYNSGNYSTYISNGSEDTASANWVNPTTVTVVGGALSSAQNLVSGQSINRVGPYAALTCRAIDSLGAGLDCIKFQSNGYSQTDTLGGWYCGNVNSPSTEIQGSITFRRTSDGTTIGGNGDIDNGWWGFRTTTTSTSTNLANYALCFSDYDTAIGAAKCWIPIGFYTGTAARMFVDSDYIPPTAAALIGDFKWNAYTNHSAPTTDTMVAWSYSADGGDWRGVEPTVDLYGISVNGASVDLKTTVGNELLITDNYAYLITARVTGARTDVSGACASVYHLLLTHKTAGTFTIDVDTPIVADATLANGTAWTFVFSVASNHLRVTCTGTVGQNVNFRAYLQLERVHNVP